MKITGLELTPVFSTREMGRSSPSDPNKSVSYHVIVRLHTDAGVVGLGEMSDIDFASDAPAVERLQRKIEPLLLGRSPFDRAAIAVDLESRTWDHQVVCGIDIAVHDAVAKALDVPLNVLFGGKLRDRIPFSYPLARCQTDADVDANIERVDWLQGLGHNMVRYYFGADIDLDHRLLTEIRRRGVSVNALDASGRLDVDVAIEAIDRLAEFEPNLVESPVSGRHDAAVEDFLAVKDAVEVPIGEHIASAEVAQRLARHDAIDVFNTGLGYAGFDLCVKTFALADLFSIKTLDRQHCGAVHRHGRPGPRGGGHDEPRPPDLPLRAARLLRAGGEGEGQIRGRPRGRPRRARRGSGARRGAPGGPKSLG